MAHTHLVTVVAMMLQVTDPLVAEIRSAASCEMLPQPVALTEISFAFPYDHKWRTYSLENTADRNKVGSVAAGARGDLKYAYIPLANGEVFEVYGRERLQLVKEGMVLAELQQRGTSGAIRQTWELWDNSKELWGTIQNDPGAATGTLVLRTNKVYPLVFARHDTLLDFGRSILALLTLGVVRPKGNSDSVIPKAAQLQLDLNPELVPMYFCLSIACRVFLFDLDKS